MKEKQLKRLSKTTIPMDFVEKFDGVWDHKQWLVFCGSIEDQGYTPIDFDQVGILLENIKTDYLHKNRSVYHHEKRSNVLTNIAATCLSAMHITFR